jgi:hypothetical protein
LDKEAFPIARESARKFRLHAAKLLDPGGGRDRNSPNSQFLNNIKDSPGKKGERQRIGKVGCG